MSGLKLYTKTNCPQCILAKDILTRGNIEFETVDITNNEEARDYVINTLGAKTMPVLDMRGSSVTIDEVLMRDKLTMKVEPVKVTDAPSVKGRDFYKPFQYPWAMELAQEHEQIHWLPTEVSLAADVMEWEEKLTQGERDLLTQLFRFFTQADVRVMQAYAGLFLPAFYKTPELAAMFGSIAAREAVHVDAYSLLIETLGLPEGEYKAFHELEAMAEKDEYVINFNMDTPEDVAKSLAVYGAFTEGVQLFSSFAILMNFPRFNKMKGMGTIVQWSIRDEDKHVDACISMYKAWLKENPQIDTDKLDKEIYEICDKMIDLEDKFIELAFGVSNVEGISADEVKQYIRSVADRRLVQLGLKKVYNVDNPLTWLDKVLYGNNHGNFFEVRVTEYSVGTVVDDSDTMDWG